MSTGAATVAGGRLINYCLLRQKNVRYSNPQKASCAHTSQSSILLMPHSGGELTKGPRLSDYCFT